MGPDRFALSSVIKIVVSLPWTWNGPSWSLL